MVTFLVSALCRILPSGKTLIFSDSRRTAEGIGQALLENDYSLVAQQLYIRFRTNSEWKKNHGDLYWGVLEELKGYYYDYLHDHINRDDETSLEIVNELFEQHIRKLARLANCRRLFVEAIITVSPVEDFESGYDAIPSPQTFLTLLENQSLVLK